MFSLKHSLSIVVTALALADVTAGAPTQTVDVAIVGGGLAGLSAAKDLVAAGKSVLVLEARERVGGRVLNAKLANGGVTEVGAEYVGPTQDRVLALIDSLGLKTYDTYINGSSVLWKDGARTVYAPDPALGGLPPIDTEGLIQTGTAQATLDVMASEIDVSAPWTHPQAEEWDSTSFGTWLDAVAPLPSARFLLDLATTSLFSAEAPELSLLYVVTYIAAAGNATTAGTLERLIASTDGAQEKRVQGGTQLIATKLAERLGARRIILNAPVRSIRKTAAGKYQVNADTVQVVARSVVIAMSPPLAARISYGPILTAARDQLCQKMSMGSIAKAIAVYKTPFWRKDGLSAQALSDSGLARSTWDNSPSDGSYGAIMGFLEADEIRAFDDKSEAVVKSAVLKDFTKYFGAQASTPQSFVLQRWDNEEFSRGGPVAVMPPRVLTRYGHALRTPVGGIHFAGTESSDYWVGYMDGAIRSGERVAKEILG